MDEELLYYSISQVAKRWGCSADKAARVLEKYRGKSGFMDLGFPARRYKRKHSIIRVHPQLLKTIEADHQ